MSLFEKCETYLDQFEIELTDEDKYLDNRFGYDEFGQIYRWNFDVPKPSADDLDKIQPKDIEKVKKKKDKKQKLKRFKSFEFQILDDEDLLNIVPYDGMIYINKKDENLYYYLNGKLKRVRVFDGV